MVYKAAGVWIGFTSTKLTSQLPVRTATGNIGLDYKMGFPGLEHTLSLGLGEILEKTHHHVLTSSLIGLYTPRTITVTTSHPLEVLRVPGEETHDSSNCFD